MIKRIRQGDKALFGQLAEKYYSEVFRYCYYQTGNEQTASDCTQETFYHLMRFLNSYTERNQFKAYLLRIALNVCRDYFRKNARKEFSYEEALERIPSAGGDLGFSGNLIHPSPEGPAETKLLVRQALSILPETQREVIVLFYYHDYRLREIANITGAPLSTVKTRLGAGTRKLQEYFQQNGLI